MPGAPKEDGDREPTAERSERCRHVAYVLIDAVIDLAWTRQRWPDAPDEFFIKPAAIAEEIWHVAHQDRSAWSFQCRDPPFWRDLVTGDRRRPS